MKRQDGGWSDWAILAAIVSLGLALRLFHLDAQSLWADEVFSATASRQTLSEMVALVVARSWNHPPLHYYVLHVWFGWFGVGALQARLLATLFGTVGILAIFLLARHLFGRRVALISALLLAVSQMGVMYSQEARMYTQLHALALCSIYAFVVAIRTDRPRAWWGFLVSSLLMMYTHYYTVFVLGALFVYGLFYRQRYGFSPGRLVGSMALIMLSPLPWLAASGAIGQAKTVVGGLVGDQPFYFAARVFSVFSTVNRFNNGKPLGLLAPSPWWAYLVGGLLFGAPLLLAVKTLARRSESAPGVNTQRENVILLLLLWTMPIVILVGLSYAAGLQYDARYVLFAMGPYYILVAFGIGQMRQTAQHVVVLLLVLYSAISLRANYFIPYKENYRDALSHVRSNRAAGDCFVNLPFGGVPEQWAIYFEDDPDLIVLDPEIPDPDSLACDRIWVVEYSRVPWAIGLNTSAVDALNRRFEKVSRSEYFWIEVGLYLPRTRAGAASGAADGTDIVSSPSASP